MYLPKASPGRASLHVKNLETDLPLFAHWTSNLADTVDFDTVSFKSSNMPIEVGVSFKFECHDVVSLMLGIVIVRNKRPYSDVEQLYRGRF